MGFPILGLLSIEFYFFDQDWLPDFMFEIWMVELAQLGRCLGSKVWHSGERRSLGLYTNSYPRMAGFFRGLQRISEADFPSEQLRNDSVIEYVRNFPRMAVSH